MKGTDIEKMCLPEASYALDLRLHHSPYVIANMDSFNLLLHP